MRSKHCGRQTSKAEKGMTLVIMAFAIVVLLAMAGLAIDLASLYVARSEAQRASDAAALAGAQSFVTSGYTSGLISAAQAQTIATQKAIDVGTQNRIGDQAPSILAADVTFSFPCPGASAGAIDPCITVTAQRSTARGNPMPTFFMKIFGVSTADVSASATAEAFNPSGSDVPVGTKCLKPWLMPNCDTSHLSPANPNCPFAAGYFVDPSTNTIVHPGPVSTGGVIGQLFTIKPGDPSAAAAPGQFYPVFLPPGSVASQCPSCATGGAGGGVPSGSLYRQNIECCNQSTIVCGAQTVTPITGNMVGPTRQGVDCLIHQGNGGTGQDILDTSTTPFQITAGANNPFFPAGTVITSSDSIVTAPIYDGSALSSGMGGSTTSVQIVGFMQLFVKDELANNQGEVEVYIMNIAACGGAAGGGPGGSGGGSGSGGAVVSGSGSPVPVRLIHN